MRRAIANRGDQTPQGRVLRLPEEGGPAKPLAGEPVASGPQSAITAADGTFSISGVPATLGPIVVALDDRFVVSSSGVPIPGGVTDVGDVVIDEGPTQVVEPPGEEWRVELCGR